MIEEIQIDLHGCDRLLDEIAPNLNLRRTVYNKLFITNIKRWNLSLSQKKTTGRFGEMDGGERTNVCVRAGASPFRRVRAGLNLLSVWPWRRIRPSRVRRKGVLADGPIPSRCALQHPSQQRSASVIRHQEQGHWRLGSGRKVAYT